MPTTKNSTNRTDTTSITTTTKEESANAELARHISAILTNPNTPPALYNAIADTVTEINSRTLIQSVHRQRRMYRDEAGSIRPGAERARLRSGRDAKTYP